MITRDHVSAALDWLEANPDKHLKGVLAKDAAGVEVSTTNPAATCFCALGRIAKEAGISTCSTGDMGITLIQDGLIEPTTPSIWKTNDRLIEAGRKAEVVPTLRKVFKL